MTPNKNASAKNKGSIERHLHHVLQHHLKSHSIQAPLSADCSTKLSRRPEIGTLILNWFNISHVWCCAVPWWFREPDSVRALWVMLYGAKMYSHQNKCGNKGSTSIC